MRRPGWVLVGVAVTLGVGATAAFATVTSPLAPAPDSSQHAQVGAAASPAPRAGPTAVPAPVAPLDPVPAPVAEPDPVRAPAAPGPTRDPAAKHAVNTDGPATAVLTSCRHDRAADGDGAGGTADPGTTRDSAARGTWTDRSGPSGHHRHGGSGGWTGGDR